MMMKARDLPRKCLERVTARFCCVLIPQKSLSRPIDASTTCLSKSSSDSKAVAVYNGQRDYWGGKLKTA